MRFIKRHIKLAVFLIAAAALGAMYAYDAVRAGSYKVELASPLPETVYADGATPVDIAVRVTRRGRPQAGHYLFALPVDGGRFTAYRAETDENGEAVFTYYPYRAMILLPAKTVEIRIIDESNSVFFEVNAELPVYIDLKEPGRGGG